MANDIYRINEFNDDERGGGNGDHRNGDISNGQLNGTTISNDHHHHHKNNSEKNRHQSMKSLMMNGNTNTVAINHSGSYNNNNNHHHHNNHCDHHQHHLFDNIHHKIINISQQSLNDTKINEQTGVDHCAHINVINHDNDNDKYRLMANNNNNNNTSNGHINNNNNNVGNVNNYCNNTNNKNSNNCKEISISVTPSMDAKTEETNMSTSLSSTTSTSSSSLMKIDSSLLTFRANLSTFLSSFSFLCIGVIFNLAVLAIIHERVPYDAATLPDIAFDLLPRYDLALNVSEYIIMFMSTSVLLMIACHRYRWIIISRLFIILGLLYIFRAICMSVTQVPVSNKDYYCSPRLNLQETSTWELIKTVIWRIIYLSLGMGLSVNGHHTYCGDFIFSGHTVILVTSDLFLVYYWLSDRRPIYFKFIKYGYHLMVIIGIIAILIARGHYMVDIVLAIVISKLIFYIYHVLCHYAIIHHNHHRYHQQQQSMKQHFEQNPFNHHHQSTDDTSIVIKADSSSTNNHRPITSDESFIYQQQQQQHCQIQRNPLNTWWYTIFEYFEKNTIHHHIQIVNSFEWPWKLFLNSKRQPLMMIV